LVRRGHRPGRSPARAPIVATIEQEYARTAAEVLANTGLLSSQPELPRTPGVRDS
jgi:hypothetical protein